MSWFGLILIGALFLFLVPLMPILMLMMVGPMDRNRIATYFVGRGGRLLVARSAWFGKGWLGTKNGVYEVRYLDASGNECLATCQTSLFGGVSLTEERVEIAAESREAQLVAQVKALEDEVRRLRAVLEQLQGK